MLAPYLLTLFWEAVNLGGEGRSPGAGLRRLEPGPGFQPIHPAVTSFPHMPWLLRADPGHVFSGEMELRLSQSFFL